MTLREDLEKYAAATHDGVWTRRAGQVVPDTDSLTLKNEAVTFDSATVLYADLADSTGLVKGYKDWFAAEVYKNYLYCAARIIRSRGGEITAYDGDRVMAVFIEGNKNSEAAKCALQIDWAVRNIIRPAIKAKYPDNTFTVEHKVGIDTSPIFAAKTGIRGSNDLVWVGNAANNAAKMAALSRGYQTYISSTVYGVLLEWAKLGGDPKRDMWTDLGTGDLGYKVYGSNFWWSL